MSGQYTELWTKKYFPQNLSDIVGQDKAVKAICRWLKTHQNYKKDKANGVPDEDIVFDRGLLVCGPSGVGKTSGVICILRSKGYRVYAFNAADARTKSNIHAALNDIISIRQVVGNKPIAVVIDEIDNMTGGEKGGLSEVMHYINPNRGKKSKKKENREKEMNIPPIVCICNDVKNKKLSDFRKDCLEVHFEKPDKGD